MSTAEERRWRGVLKTDNDWVLDQGQTLWPEDEYVDAEVVRSALRTLDEKHREAVVLRIWGRYTFREIAEELGWPSRGYAWMYYKRGLEKLRAELGDMF